MRFVRDEVFAFFAELGQSGAHNFMNGARLTIDEPTVLTQVVHQTIALVYLPCLITLSAHPFHLSIKEKFNVQRYLKHGINGCITQLPKANNVTPEKRPSQ